MSKLERELATYKRWMSTPASAGLNGRWVVIHHEQVLGHYPDFDSALEAGYNAYGLDELFMAREIGGPTSVVWRARTYRPI